MHSDTSWLRAKRAACTAHVELQSLPKHTKIACCLEVVGVVVLVVVVEVVPVVVVLVVVVVVAVVVVVVVVVVV